jgi:hypothetical protein
MRSLTCVIRPCFLLVAWEPTGRMHIPGEAPRYVNIHATSGLSIESVSLDPTTPNSASHLTRPRPSCLILHPTPCEAERLEMSDTAADAEPQAKRKCLGADCSNDAGTLHCPTCLKQGVKDSFFCSQDCFKRNWVGLSAS